MMHIHSMGGQDFPWTHSLRIQHPLLG